VTGRVLVRAPTAALANALSKHAERDRIDAPRATLQHAAFVSALRDAGIVVEELAAEADMPDATFVSDCLIAFGDGVDHEAPPRLLVVTRPGALSRRSEVSAVAERARLLAPAAEVLEITRPGTLDGGDVIVFGDRVAIGVSARTDQAGARQLADAVGPLGYRNFLCPVEGRLHLASEVTVLGPMRLVGTPAGFASLDAVGAADGAVRIVLDPDDATAANVLALGGRCFMAAGHPRAAAALRDAGETVVELDLSEFTRADGGPTCLVAIV
jgi:dimethylargininase